MMKQLLTNAYVKISKIKIVHSTPGRVRLQVPGLKQVPEEYRHLETELLDLVTLLPGVNNLSLCYITGRALLHFDPAVIDDEKLVAWFNRVWKTIAAELAKRDDLSQEAEIIAHVIKEIHRNIETFNREFSK